MSSNLMVYSRRKWRRLGYHVEGTETVTRYGNKVLRHDLFGFVDMIAIKPGRIVLVQVTSWTNVSARANKIAREKTGTGQHRTPMFDLALILLSTPNVEIIVEGWRKSKTTHRWECRELLVTANELNARRQRAD